MEKAGLIFTSVGGWVGPRVGVWSFEKYKNLFPAIYYQRAGGPAPKAVTISTRSYKGQSRTWSKNVYSHIMDDVVTPFHVRSRVQTFPAWPTF